MWWSLIASWAEDEQYKGKNSLLRRRVLVLDGREDELNEFQPRWIPLLLWWLILFIEALVLSPNIDQEGSQQWPIQKGTTSTAYPDKSSLRLPKALVVTPSCRPASVGLIALIWKPLLHASVLRACACSL